MSAPDAVSVKSLAPVTPSISNAPVVKIDALWPVKSDVPRLSIAFEALVNVVEPPVLVTDKLLVVIAPLCVSAPDAVSVKSLAPVTPLISNAPVVKIDALWPVKSDVPKLSIAFDALVNVVEPPVLVTDKLLVVIAPLCVSAPDTARVRSLAPVTPAISRSPLVAIEAV